MLCISIGSSFFGFWGEDPRPNQPDQILVKKDPPSTVGVVESAGGPPGSGQVYRVGWATG